MARTTLACNCSTEIFSVNDDTIQPLEVAIYEAQSASYSVQFLNTMGFLLKLICLESDNLNST